MMEQTKRKVENARTNMKIAVALHDLTASEISMKAGLSVNVLGKYLRGETMISFAGMQAVCDIMGLPLALITSERQITPARIRLHKIVARMTDDDIAEFIKNEPLDSASNWAQDDAGQA
jgi:transcriptional regulator with XRE-family HTH domain